MKQFYKCVEILWSKSKSNIDIQDIIENQTFALQLSVDYFVHNK